MSLAHRLRRIFEGRLDILWRQGWVGFKQDIHSVSIGNAAHDDTDRDAGSPDTGLTAMWSVVHYDDRIPHLVRSSSPDVPICLGK